MTNKILITSLIITLLSIFSGAVNWTFQFAFNSILYFMVIDKFVFNLNSNKLNLKYLLILVLPFLLTYGIASLYPWLISGINMTHVIPIIFSPLFGFIFAILYRLLKAKKILQFPYIIIIIFVCAISMENWLLYAFDDENPIHKSFPDLALKDIKNENFQFKKDKLIVLDLWATSCASCIKGFPEFEKLTQKYQDVKNIEFYTLNLPIKRDSNKNIKRYVENYKFNSLFTTNLSAWEELENHTVPKLLVLNKHRTIIYKGSLNDKWYHLYNNINAIIAQNKND